MKYHPYIKTGYNSHMRNLQRMQPSLSLLHSFLDVLFCPTRKTKCQSESKSSEMKSHIAMLNTYFGSRIFHCVHILSKSVATHVHSASICKWLIPWFRGTLAVTPTLPIIKRNNIHRPVGILSTISLGSGFSPSDLATQEVIPTT